MPKTVLDRKKVRNICAKYSMGVSIYTVSWTLCEHFDKEILAFNLIFKFYLISPKKRGIVNLILPRWWRLTTTFQDIPVFSPKNQMSNFTWTWNIGIKIHIHILLSVRCFHKRPNTGCSKHVGNWRFWKNGILSIVCCLCTSTKI